MQTIGTTFKKIREERNLLLEDITKRTGISKAVLSRIENGKRLPTREQVNQLCKYYKTEKNEIIVQWLSDKLLYEVKDEDFALQAMQIAEDKIKYGTSSNGQTNDFVLSLNEHKQKRKINDFVNKVVQGDCLEVMQSIPNKSIDMILCDLPYGTTQNKWDSVIDLQKLWAEYERIIKDNGAIVLTSQGIFTAKLILSNEKLFKYKITWIKSKSTNFLNAKKQPLRKHEDICIFYKKQPTYNPQMTVGEPYDKGIRKDQYTGSYGDFKPKHVKSNGERYPNDIVFFEEQNVDDFVYIKTAESEGTVYHPTQKPIELRRYLTRRPNTTLSEEPKWIEGKSIGVGWNERSHWIISEKSSKPEYQLNQLERFFNKEEVKPPLQQAVHCKTQEEWDFVTKKLNRNNEWEEDYPCQILVGTSDWKGRVQFCIAQGIQILSFQEWCDLNEYKMKKTRFKKGDYVVSLRPENLSTHSIKSNYCYIQ